MARLGRTLWGALVLLGVGCRATDPGAKADTGDSSSAAPDTAPVDDTSVPADSSGDDSSTLDTHDSVAPDDTATEDTATSPQRVEDGDNFASAKLIGEEAGDAYEYGVFLSVAGGGDVDGDGRADLLVGLGNHGDGVVYVVTSDVAGSFDLALADARLIAAGRSDDAAREELAGVAVAILGDTDGDGFADILVGAPAYAEDRDNVTEGQAYLIRGPVTGDVNLDDSDGIFHGDVSRSGSSHDWEYEGQTGAAVAAPGDTDGDGLADILVGSWGLDAGAGAVYLLLGPSTGVRELETDYDAVVRGAFGDWAGYAVAGAGDVDGDGLADLLVGQPEHTTDRLLLFLGPLSGDLTAADAAATVTDAGECVGCTTAGAGDTDGDGYEDFLVGSPEYADGGEDAGAVFIFRGPKTGTVPLSAAEASLTGHEPGQRLATAASAGDIDGDGRDDLMASGVWGGDPGAVYLALAPFAGRLSTSDVHLRVDGRDGDMLGYALAGVGDVDQDGVDDVLIGGPGDDDGGEGAGAAWLLLGALMR